MAQAELQIVNRGSEDVPFGFIYAEPNHRGYFSVTEGELRLGGSGSGYWSPLTPDQMLRAATLLAERFHFTILV